ncbi:MAG: type II toxin-antitoxin system VapC family toxin [bacterium]|nr:type II toxin-antitoxin system VapC family toxin [bacterium]
MIVDSSAVVAILLQEPGFDELLTKLLEAKVVGIGTPTLTEAAIVLSARLQGDARGLIARFLQEGSIAEIPFGEAHYGVAVEAWLKYGKGKHDAALNFGDCMSYAVSKLAGQPLLCIGRDFPRTDLVLA